MLNYQADQLIASQPEWRFGDFAQNAYQLSAALKQRQVHSLAVWFEDSAKLTCTLLAAWHAGVKVLFPPNLTPESLSWIAQHADLCISDLAPEQLETESFDALCALSDFAAEIDPPLALFDLDNQTEIWLKTSGSTGEAKTIVKTARQMWLGGAVLAHALPFAANNAVTAISTVSAQHIYGLTVQIMMSLVNGWQIGRKQQFYPECILTEAQTAQQAVVISSPAMLTRIDWHNTKLPASFAGVISSGGALPEETSEQMRQQLQQPVVEIYGSTETGPIAIRDDIQLWQPLPDSQLGSDENGTLWIEGSWLSQREQTADVVEFEGKGFRLLGRRDRIVKIGDKRTSLASIENKLNQHPWVEDCYIAQHPEQNRLAAWVGLNNAGIETLREEGRRHLTEAFKAYLAENQEKSAIPRFWRLTDKLPRNSQSKINKLEFNRVCVEPQQDAIWLEEQGSDQGYLATGKVPVDLVYLKDHFATFPLVPGVIELQWIQEKMSEWLAQPVQILRVEKLKFQKFLRPNDEFELRLIPSSQSHKITFQLKVGQEICCSGVAVIG